VPHPAVSFALKEIRSAPQHRTISDLTEQIGLSPRRFIRLFSEEVGLTPKLFCRVRRFQQVLKSLQNGELSARQIEWADIASSCGYFDQAHFIRDFRAFSGLNPTAWFMLRGQHINHVPLKD
jgi:AraC-like DNA-binding protein